MHPSQICLHAYGYQAHKNVIIFKYLSRKGLLVGPDPLLSASTMTDTVSLITAVLSSVRPTGRHLTKKVNKFTICKSG